MQYEAGKSPVKSPRGVVCAFLLLAALFQSNVPLELTIIQRWISKLTKKSPLPKSFVPLVVENKDFVWLIVDAGPGRLFFVFLWFILVESCAVLWKIIGSLGNVPKWKDKTRHVRKLLSPLNYKKKGEKKHFSKAMPPIDCFPLGSFLCVFSSSFPVQHEVIRKENIQIERNKFPCRGSAINSCCCHWRDGRNFDCRWHSKVRAVWTTAGTQLLLRLSARHWEEEHREIKRTRLTDDGCHFACASLPQPALMLRVGSQGLK